MTDLIESVRGADVQRAGQGGRFYLWKRERLWSVTTILNGGVPKPALVNWAKKFVAEYAVENLDVLTAMVKKAASASDRQGAVDWLKNSPFRDRDAKANLGTIVHDIAEAYVIGRPYPAPTAEQQPYVDTFISFLADFTPTFVAVEMPVFNMQYRYAGTLDAIMDISTDLIPESDVWGPTPEGRPWRVLADWKTGASGPWPEVGMQLAAYRNAEFVGQPNDREAPMPATDGAAVLKIRPEGYEFYPVRSDQTVLDAFLYAREVYRWAQDTSRNIIGDQLISGTALARALEASLEAGGEATGEKTRHSGTAASETSVDSSSGEPTDEGTGGQAKAISSPELNAEEPAPVPSSEVGVDPTQAAPASLPKPRKPRAKKATT